MPEMLSEPARDRVAPFLRTCQIIAAAMPAGVIGLTAVFLVLGPSDDRDANALPIISIVAVGFFAIELIAKVVVMTAMRAKTPEPPTDEEIIDESAASGANASLPPKAQAYFGHLQTQMIIGSALLEGAALLSAIAYLIEGRLWVLGITALAVVLLLLNIPTMSSWEDRLRVDRQRFDADRNVSPFRG